MKESELISYFQRGETHRLIEISLADYQKAGKTGFLIGALVLSGDFERALALAATHESKDTSGLIPFYLSLGFSRAGRYAEALDRIARIEAMGTGGLLAFFAEQGRGFYCFNSGENDRAIEHARKALAIAESSHEALQPLARILSLDLLGHSLIRTGLNRRGIKTLRLARDAAARIRHENYTQAITISILKYESIFGLEPTRAISRLYRALVELKPDDSYSRSEIRLELARQLILRGQFREARRHLEDAAGEVLGSQNKLQTTSLHLRLAWMAKLEGRLMDALLALQAAETGIAMNAPGNNGELLIKIGYFRLNLYRQLGREREANELEVKLRSSTNPLNGIESRLFRRHMKSGVSPTISLAIQEPTKEDPFGELMDRIAARKTGIELELLEGGFFGLLLPLLGVELGQTAIVLGAPNGRVIVLDDGETRIVQGGLKGLLGRLLARLADGPCTKCDAIESVWGYSYESERHDRLLMVAISRIRKALGGKSMWLELQGERLILRDRLLIRFWANTDVPRGRVTSIIPTAKAAANSRKRGLRIRQLQVLDDLATRGDIGVQDLVRRFGISRASALRDLNELVDAGLLLRAGETRATRYLIVES